MKRYRGLLGTVRYLRKNRLEAVSNVIPYSVPYSYNLRKDIVDTT